MSSIETHAAPPSTSRAEAQVAVDRSDGVVIRLTGAWHLDRAMPSSQLVEDALAAAAPHKHVTIDASGLARWDSSLVSFVLSVAEYCRGHSLALDRSGLPEGVRRLTELAETVPEIKDARPAYRPENLAERVGDAVLNYVDAAGKAVDFLGLFALAMGRFLVGRARLRASDLLEVIQNSGARALGIVTLITYLVGIIFAFMGAMQLQQIGASIYVADLVSIGVIRDMGAMMTGIIMAGRTGAAFAAELGSMKVTEEIDAISTMGISPMEFLVIPRVVGLVLMMPLLCVYADFVGILGGATVGVGMLGISFTAYMHETVRAITTGGLVGGLFKATVYGLLIALAGCYEGFECGNSSSAVGLATTAAVVNGIVMIIVACGLFAVLFNILGV